MNDPLENLSTPQRIAQLVSDSQDSLAPVHQLMDEERAFCWELQQFIRDTGNTRDRNRVQPRDQSVFRQARYKASEMLKTPPYFKARPIDPMSDPQTAKWARWAIDFDITDPVKRFDRIVRDVVWAGLTSRIGCMTQYWQADQGVFGDIGYCHVDGKDIGWAPGFTDPHDPGCPWFYEIKRLRPDAIARQRGWSNTTDVAPDSGLPSTNGNQNSQDVHGKVSFAAFGKPEAGEMQTQRFVTVVLFWERFGGKGKSNATHRVLTDQERYMVISEGEQAGTKVAVDYGPDPMPAIDVMPDGTPIKRIDAVLSEEEHIAYPNGKLTICAPWSGQGETFYEGDWPQPMRSFPYLVWQPYASPFKQIGPSDVDLNWTMTLVKNGTTRRWYEQLQESRGFMALPNRGLKDLNDEPFNYVDANGFVAKYDNESVMNGCRYVEGPQPSPQLERFIQYADGALRSNEGTSDMSVSGNPDQLKGVAVGAMERAVQTGNVAVDDHMASWQIELGLFLSITHDIQRARWTEKRWVRYLGPQGRDAWMRLRGADIPAADIVITTKPTLDQLHADQLDSVMKLVNLAQTNPAAAKVAARHMDIDPDDLNDILASVQPPMPPPMGPQVGGPPGPGGPPGTPPPPPAPAYPGPTPAMQPA